MPDDDEVYGRRVDLKVDPGPVDEHGRPLDHPEFGLGEGLQELGVTFEGAGTDGIAEALAMAERMLLLIGSLPDPKPPAKAQIQGHLTGAIAILKTFYQTEES